MQRAPNDPKEVMFVTCADRGANVAVVKLFRNHHVKDIVAKEMCAIGVGGMLQVLLTFNVSNYMQVT
jgi:hypothetical protein